MNIFTISNVPVIASQGSGYVIQGFVDRLREHGHTVDLLTPGDYQRWPGLTKAHRLRLQLGYTSALKRAIRSGHYDLIQAFGAEAWQGFSHAHKLAQRPLLLAHSNGVEPHVTEQLRRIGAEESTRLGKLFDAFLHYERAFSCADGVITVSEFDADYVRQKGWQSPDAVTAINNSLPVFFLGQEIEHERPLRIGYCGTWTSLKGKDALETALPRLAERFPQAEFEIVGTLDSLQPEKVFPPAFCERLVHLPKLTREELRERYHQWSIALMPSRYESFGLAAAEAMACGAALVATRRGFPASLEDGAEALLIDHSEPSVLAERIALLLKDEPKRRQIAQAGWQRVQSLSWAHAYERFEAFIASLKARASAKKYT